MAMLEDVLIATLDLLRHTPPGRIPLLAGSGGAQLFVSLLSREQPALRILGLHLLAYFVPYMHAKGASPTTYIGALMFVSIQCFFIWMARSIGSRSCQKEPENPRK